jgi:hypothetical protein
LKALKQFFFAGLQGQQLFLVLALSTAYSSKTVNPTSPR